MEPASDGILIKLCEASHWWLAACRNSRVILMDESKTLLPSK